MLFIFFCESLTIRSFVRDTRYKYYVDTKKIVRFDIFYINWKVHIMRGHINKMYSWGWDSRWYYVREAILNTFFFVKFYISSRQRLTPNSSIKDFQMDSKQAVRVVFGIFIPTVWEIRFSCPKFTVGLRSIYSCLADPTFLPLDLMTVLFTDSLAHPSNLSQTHYVSVHSLSSF